ncbi:MAG: glycosyltransferase family 2 protein [Candidatus Omnitrophica bacterium]|nr:glycosyltransferase family 2 protein [Candidatus Omnitrophota bacterium]
MDQTNVQSNAGREGLPLVSVVMPFYNHFGYINETLRSCMETTYPNLEIIIVDDASGKLLTMEDLSEVPKKHPITIIRNSSNWGSGYSRNVGIRKARGEFIAFLDSDDIWFPEIVKKQMNVFLSDPQAAWVYTDGYYLIDEKRSRKPNSAYHGFGRKGFPTGKEVNEYHLRGYNYMTFSSLMFKKSVLIDAGLFNEDINVSEDWDLFVRVAEKYPAHAINEPLMLYRVNNNGRHFVNRKSYVSVNTKILTDMYKRQGLFPSRIDDFNRAVAIIYQRAGIQRLNANKHDEARHFLFDRKTRPLRFEFRMICLRILSVLPNMFYRAALWTYNIF